MTDPRARDRLSMSVEHFQNAILYSRRGREVFFDAKDPDTLRLIEGELRKAYESLNRQGDSFFNANPKLDRPRIAEVRQLLTHDYGDLGPEQIWRLVTTEAPGILRLLSRAKLPG